MNIAEYLSCFHDGNLIDIKHSHNHIEFTLESSVIEERNVEGELILSKRKTIKGRLHLLNVQRVKINNELFNKILSKDYDDGEILDLEITDHKMLLLIEWKSFSSKSRINDVSKIEVEAEKIYWENIPELDSES